MKPRIRLSLMGNAHFFWDRGPSARTTQRDLRAREGRAHPPAAGGTRRRQQRVRSNTGQILVKLRGSQRDGRFGAPAHHKYRGFGGAGRILAERFRFEEIGSVRFAMGTARLFNFYGG